MKKIVYTLIVCLGFVFSNQAQTTCATAEPFCAGGNSGGSFPASTNIGDAESGPDYGCLGSEPNPAWYFLQVSQSGSIVISIAGSANQDVDFICWGPFSNPATCCNSLTASYIVDCSYSSSYTETCTIPNAIAGQFYMLLITNYSNVVQNINFSQVAGNGSTNCGIVSSNTMICEGSVATISITNNSNLLNPTYSIQPTAQTSTIPHFTVAPTVTTTYTLYITGTNTINNTILTQTAVSTVTIMPKPVINPNVVNSTCASMSNSVNLNITFNPNSSPNYTVTWNPNPAAFTSVNSGTASGLLPGTENVTVSTGSCSTVASFTVGPIQIPASFTVFNSVNNYTVTCLNPNVVLTTSVTNGNPLTYVWIPSCSGTVSGASANFTQSCIGQVIGTSSTGCTHTETYTVYQDFTAPTVVISPTVISITCIPGGSCFTLTTNMGPNVTTQWYQVAGTNSVPVGPAQGTINIFCPGNPGNYSGCSTNNLTGCVACKSVQVTASVGVPSFTMTSPSNFTIGCSTTSVTSMQVSTVITSPVPNVPVNYAYVVPPGTATPVYTINPNLNNITVPGTYVVYIKDLTNSCVSSQSVSIIQNTIAPNVDYIQPLTILTCKDPMMVLNGISSNTNTAITWTVPATPSSSVDPTPNATVVINPAITNATNNVTSVGVYTVGAVDNNNLCRSTKTVQINQDIRIPKFTISALTNSVINCKNPDVVIVPIVTPSLAVALVPTYVWYPPIGPGVPGTQFNSTSAGSHTSISTSVVNGCTASATYVIATDLTPPALTTANSFTLDCSNNPTVYIVPAITPSVGPYTFTWTAPPGVLISNPSAQNLEANLTGLYKVGVTNTVNGCSAYEAYSVVPGGLIADFVPSLLQGFAPMTVTFNNTSATSTGASSILCLWSFGNGVATPSTILNSISPSATYTSSGTYSVVLIATKGSCKDSAMHVIRVDVPSKMEVPNVFTPNGDKVNDIFRLIASNLTEISVSIFDRWGNKVYELTSDTGNFGWDGKNQSGKDCPAGVYFYIIKATGKDSQTYDQKGNVSLFR